MVSVSFYEVLVSFHAGAMEDELLFMKTVLIEE
jgi:hypothetical protein